MLVDFGFAHIFCEGYFQAESQSLGLWVSPVKESIGPTAASLTPKCDEEKDVRSMYAQHVLCGFLQKKILPASFAAIKLAQFSFVHM